MTNENLTYPHERKLILQVYIFFGISILLSVVPFLAAAGLSCLLICAVLVAAYIIRARNPENSLTENHMTYIIRTIWIGSTLAMVTVTAGCIYLYKALDNSPLDPCLQTIYSFGNPSQMINFQHIGSSFGGCFFSYMAANLMDFIIAALICAGPVLLYFFIRYMRGLSRALKGNKIPEPQTWF